MGHLGNVAINAIAGNILTDTSGKQGFLPAEFGCINKLAHRNAAFNGIRNFYADCGFAGIGASMRTLVAARLSAISSTRFVIFETLVPTAGLSS